MNLTDIKKLKPLSKLLKIKRLQIIYILGFFIFYFSSRLSWINIKDIYISI